MTAHTASDAVSGGSADFDDANFRTSTGCRPLAALGELEPHEMILVGIGQAADDFAFRDIHQPQLVAGLNDCLPTLAEGHRPDCTRRKVGRFGRLPVAGIPDFDRVCVISATRERPRAIGGQCHR